MKIVTGLKKFQSDVFPAKRGLFEKLDRGQSPEVAFVTCSDSRIDPSLITQSEPGELFVIRNAGNIIPPPETGLSGESASVEFAIEALGVKHVVICGHSDCGAMKAVLDPQMVSGTPQVAEWIKHAEPAIRVAEDRNSSSATQLMKLTEANVLTQMRNLRSQPLVAARVAAGEVRIHGWIYEIGSGQVRAYAEETGRFEALGEP